MNSETEHVCLSVLAPAELVCDHPRGLPVAGEHHVGD